MADVTLPRTQAEEARIIGERLVVMLHRTGIGQRHLADQLGWGKNSISEVKRGKRHLTLTQLRQLADALGTTAEYLLGLTEDPKGGEPTSHSRWNDQPASHLRECGLPRQENGRLAWATPGRHLAT